jgi:hypothetical protein
MRGHIFGHLFEHVDATLVRTDTLPSDKAGDEQTPFYISCLYYMQHK